jgi:hypothetical protein
MAYSDIRDRLTPNRFEVRQHSTRADGITPRFGVWDNELGAWARVNLGYVYITLLKEAAQEAADRRNAISAQRPMLDVAAPGIHEIFTVNSSESTAGRVFTTGRDAKGRFASSYRHVRLYITPRGHWYRGDDAPDDFHNDILCRGCGHHGHFPYILDYKPCSKPATSADVIAALRAS